MTLMVRCALALARFPQPGQLAIEPCRTSTVSGNLFAADSSLR